MPRKIISYLFIPLVLILALGLSGCNKKVKTMILFNHAPITKETILNTSVEFKTGQRIYYIFLTEEPMVSKYIRVQVLKQNEHVDELGTVTAYSDFRKLEHDQVYYYTNYIVLHDPGHYNMIVSSKERPDWAIVSNDFYVK